MNEVLVLSSIFILHLLVIITLLRLKKVKVIAVKNKEVSIKDFILTKDSQMNGEILNVSNHLRNLFQIPLLFQVLALVFLATGKLTTLTTILCVCFSISRVAHSYIHLMTQNVRLRFKSFIVGLLILMIMWIQLLVSFI